jgi:hypothetical protein
MSHMCTSRVASSQAQVMLLVRSQIPSQQHTLIAFVSPLLSTCRIRSESMYSTSGVDCNEHVNVTLGDSMRRCKSTSSSRRPLSVQAHTTTTLTPTTTAKQVNRVHIVAMAHIASLSDSEYVATNHRVSGSVPDGERMWLDHHLPRSQLVPVQHVIHDAVHILRCNHYAVHIWIRIIRVLQAFAQECGTGGDGV